jgi:hypothetical protein
MSTLSDWYKKQQDAHDKRDEERTAQERTAQERERHLKFLKSPHGKDFAKVVMGQMLGNFFTELLTGGLAVEVETSPDLEIVRAPSSPQGTGEFCSLIKEHCRKDGA